MPLEYQTKEINMMASADGQGASIMNSSCQTLGNHDNEKEIQAVVKKSFNVDNIAEEIQNQLNKTKIRTNQIEKIEFGKTPLKGDNVCILSWNEKQNQVDLMKKKNGEKPNPNIKYSSPIQIFDSEEKVNLTDEEGMLFYIALKYKKDQKMHCIEGDSVPDSSNGNIMDDTHDADEDTESDSGVGDSGNSRSGDSPECLDSEMTIIDDILKDKLDKNKNDTSLFNAKIKNKPLENKVMKSNLTDLNNQHQKDRLAKLIQRQMIRQKYTIIKRRSRSIHPIKDKKKEDVNQKMETKTKPMWFVPGSNSFHVNINPNLSSLKPKCYSFQCKPRVVREPLQLCP